MFVMHSLRMAPLVGAAIAMPGAGGTQAASREVPARIRPSALSDGPPVLPVTAEGRASPAHRPAGLPGPDPVRRNRPGDTA
ncbi:hypothetical protein VQH23_01760 [Pararoseomonas sp. SCSIO 73927]|uniref:hypothetical protein n=1 Tax=Pararoseomonas sp. SCSIO 73927 TaxID=3114537 RepID=UPI0030D2829E